MRIIYCCDPLDTKQVDPPYEQEAEAAKALGFETALFSFETLVYENNINRALGRVPTLSEETSALYRGWMLKPEQYHTLYTGLLGRGWRLINTLEQYQHAHYMPDSYPVIQHLTPLTIWVKVDDSLDTIMNHLSIFEGKPVLLRDYAKSQKHYWEEACFIPSAADSTEVERVVRRFKELQGDDLNVGLVFREFVQLEALAVHEKSKMPLSKEFRIFWLDTEPLYAVPYWETGNYAGSAPPLDLFQETAQRINSRFFTMDVARRTNGEWIIIELGDGQVAGLPERSAPMDFYQNLRRKLI
jgi:hypothetical protein